MYVLLEFMQNMDNPYYEPTIMVYDSTNFWLWKPLIKMEMLFACVLLCFVAYLILRSVF